MNKSYRSDLRRDQKQETRSRILDGLARAMASGLAELSIPAVARQARVSVPTVYRHFPTKKALLDALAEHVERRGTGGGEVPAPTDPEGLAALTPELFRRLDALDDATRAAMASRLGTKMRRDRLIPERRKMIQRALAPAFKGLDAAGRTRLVDVVLVLWSSASLRAFKDYLGLDAEQAAGHVAWAIRRLAGNRR